MTQSSFNTTKALIISTPVPEQTRTYKPVEHGQLIDLTLDGIEKAGFTLDREEYTSAVCGRVANGRFTIKSVQDAEMQLEVGWQNSYDKSLTLKFAIGTRIFICQNGCVSGDMGTFKKKHVGEIQTFTPSAISEYIKSAGDTFRQMQVERELMKQVQVTKRTSAELIGRMMIEESFIASTQMNIIKEEMNKPTFDYGADGSLWQLYQHTTYAMKEVHPTFWMANHIKAHKFFNDLLPSTKLDLITLS
jgi:hypothetical protein